MRDGYDLWDGWDDMRTDTDEYGWTRTMGGGRLTIDDGRLIIGETI